MRRQTPNIKRKMAAVFIALTNYLMGNNSVKFVNIAIADCCVDDQRTFVLRAVG